MMRFAIHQRPPTRTSPLPEGGGWGSVTLRARTAPCGLSPRITSSLHHLITSSLSLLLLLLLTLLPSTTLAQPAGARGRSTAAVAPSGALTVNAFTDASSITTAQRLRLTFNLTLGPGLILAADDANDRLREHWTIVNERRDPPSDTPGGGTRLTRSYLLEPSLPGEYRVPPITFRWRPADEPGAEPGSLTTAAIPITVRSVLPAGEEATPADIKGVAEAPFRLPFYVWIGLAAALGVVAAFAGALFFLAWRARRERQIRAAAHEIALKRLTALRAEDFPAKGEFKKFFQAASLILRRYIEDRFSLRAPERTTQEFLEEARTSGHLGPDDVGLLERFLSHADLVKFAELQPTPAQTDEALRTIEDFLNHTRIDEPQVVVATVRGEERTAVHGKEDVAP